MENLLRELKERNISISLDNDDLKLKFNGAGLPDELISELRDNKQQLIRYLMALNKNSVVNSIPAVDNSESYPLSASQRRLVIMDQIKEGNLAYNMPGVYLFEGELHIGSLADSFDSLIQRHENLRTVFKEDETGGFRQFILPAGDAGFKIDYLDLREGPWEAQVKELLHEKITNPFDLALGPLLRVGVFHIADHKWIFYYVMHHIITDGWSMGILITELLTLYNSYRHGAVNPLPPLRIQYKDYACWQQEQLRGAVQQAGKRYWFDQLAGELPVLKLSTDYPRPVMKSYGGAAINSTIPAGLVKALKKFGQAKGTTLFMNLLAVVNTLLYRYTGQEDIVVGSSIAGREHTDLEDQIGFYVNALALRTRFKGEDSYDVLVDKVQRITLEAYEHQMYPFDEIVNGLRMESIASGLGLATDSSRNPLFDVFVDFHDAGIDPFLRKRTLEGLTISSYETGGSVISKFDMTFVFIESGDEVGFLLEYNTGLFRLETAERMALHFMNLLKAVVTSPGLPVKRLEFLEDEEKNRLLHEFNTTPGNISGYRPVIALFEEMVNAFPDEVATIYGDTTLTYRELNERANRLGHYLQNQLRTGHDRLVGIMLDRSDNLIIAILGILRSGAGYVPIDPAYPAARKQYIIKDTGIRTLITQTEYIFDLEYFDGEAFAIDAHTFTADTQSGKPGTPYEPEGTIHRPEDIAYVIYTSGSTGEPKGCAITHGGLSNYIQWANNYYFDDRSRPGFGLYTSLSFDLTVTSIFCCLTKGGKLYIYGQYEDYTEIFRHSFSKESGIDSIKLTPSHISLLKYLGLESTTMLRAVVGGEQITPAQVNVLKGINPYIEIYNEYGPTEATVGCIVKKLEAGAPILIGKPIQRTEVYILGEGDTLLPIGVAGEICIGGAGLAKGYLNKPELTAERFIPDPFKKEGRIYTTGDTGRWMPDGDIEFIGRSDDQVKIWGHRVELGEIETVLQRYEGVDETVAIAGTNEDGEQQLVAYFVGKGNPDINDIRSYLGANLPEYMLPAYIIQLQSLPLTINGKIDRKNLPDPQGAEWSARTEYIAPRNEIEEKLTSIWQEVLERDRIGIRDNFFELGGNSLKLIRIAGLINKLFDKKISVVQLFQFSNISGLADFLSSDVQNETESSDTEAKMAMTIMEGTFSSLKYPGNEQ